MIDHIRKNKRFEPITEVNDHLGMVSNTYTGASESLQACLSTLPEIQQHVLMLRDYEGYDYKEIGLITGLNESQVKVYIFRARTALKSLIGKKEVIL
jgi:RNA polymerase sigma-70 factor (ECF subfamily)